MPTDTHRPSRADQRRPSRADQRRPSRAEQNRPSRVIAATAAPEANRPARIATAIAVIGALLVAAASLLSALAPQLGAARPDSGRPVVAAVLVAVACALAAPALACAALARGRAGAAGALIGAAGAVSAGLVVVDLALWFDPINANRLELFRPITAAHLDPGPGAAAVLLGHVLGAVAGVIGLVAVARAAQADGYGGDGSLGRRIGTGLTVAAIGATAAILLGSLAEPWTTTDPILVVHSLLASDAATAIGVAMVAIAVLVTVAVALVAESAQVGSAALLGSGIAALGFFGARAAAGLIAQSIGLSAGSALAALGAVVLIGVGALTPRAVREPSTQASPAGVPRGRQVRRSNASAGQDHSHLAAAAAGLVAGLLAVAGSLLPVLTVPDGIDRPQILAARVALVAGVIVGATSAAMFVRRAAAAVRPAVGVLWVGLIAALGSVLQAVVVGVGVPGVGVGPGAVALGASVIAAAVTGVLCWRAGSIERETVGADDVDSRTAVLVVSVPAALVSMLALALPLYSGADFTPPGMTDWPWGWDVWGRAALAVALVAVAVVVARARPARGAAGAVGAAVAMGVYMIGWPLTNGRIAEPVVGPGFWAAIIGVVLFAVAAFVAVRPNRS